MGITILSFFLQLLAHGMFPLSHNTRTTGVALLTAQDISPAS